MSLSDRPRSADPSDEASARRWLERLAGRGAALDDAAEEREVQLLRKALVRRQEFAEAQEARFADPQRDERSRKQLQALVSAAAPERGLAPSSAPPARGPASSSRSSTSPAASPPRRLFGLHWGWLQGAGAFAGAVLTVMIVVPMLNDDEQSAYPAPYRAASAALPAGNLAALPTPSDSVQATAQDLPASSPAWREQVLQDKNGQARVQEIAQRLEAAGVPVTVGRLESGDFVLDISPVGNQQSDAASQALRAEGLEVAPGEVLRLRITVP